MSRRSLTAAVLALLAFAVWTAVVHSGIAHGSRHSAYRLQTYGAWPSEIDAVGGSSNIEYAMYASFAQPTGDGDGAALVADLMGRAAVGTEIDSANSGYMNGSRFVAPLRAGTVTGLSVYVAAPVDAAPFDEFQMAIYTDRDGGPGRLLAVSQTGHLVGDAWNTATTTAELRPGTAYWIMFNTNGRSASVNNSTFQRVTAAPLDAVIQAHRSDTLDTAASRITSLANLLPATLAIGIVGLLGWRRRRLQVIVMAAGYVLMLAIGLAIRELLFAPYHLYPSGHALRSVYLAVSIGWIFRRTALTLLAGLGAATVCVAAVYERGHYAEEIIGGVLLAVFVALTARWLGERRPTAPEPGVDDQTDAPRDVEVVSA